MKKLLTFSLVALLAVAGFAKVKPGTQKAYQPQANVELSSKQYTTAKEKIATLASKPARMLKGNRLVQPKDAYPYNPNYGASFDRPQNSFYAGLSSEGYSLIYNRLFAMPFTTLTFENTSTDLFDWAYTDPYTEDELTSDVTNLTFEVGEYNIVGAPVLTMPGAPTDTVYSIGDYMQIAGGCSIDWGEGEGGWLGATNYNPDWDGFYYSTRYYAANVPSVNSTYTQDYAQYGVDTVKVVGYAELINKPTSPYVLYNVCIPMLVGQAGDVTLAVYKAVQDEDGNWELGDRLSAEVTVRFREANMSSITYAQFKDLVYEDPETGLEETLVIDDAVFVLVTTSVQNYPLHWYHDEPLPSERHAFNLINYTIDGEEYEMIDDVNYRFTYTDGSSSYVSAFSFSYDIEMCYMHNNEETDIFNAPVEGGEKTFNISSYYSSAAWEITDMDYQDIPDWITVDLEDGSEEYQGVLYYSGLTDATFTVEALPADVDYREADVLLSYDGAKCIIHVKQGNVPIVVVPGDVNGDGTVTAADITALYNWLLDNDDSSLVNGDQNGDGEITAGDVTAVYNILLGSGK